MPDLAVALDLQLEIRRDRVDGAHADAMQTGGHLVAAIVEFAASVQHRHHHLGGAHPLGVLIDRDAAAVVRHRHGLVRMKGDVDVRAMAREVLVDRVIDRLPHQVVQARAVVHVTDVHARPLAHRFETFERGDAAGIIGSFFRWLAGNGLLGRGFSHDFGWARKRRVLARPRGGSRFLGNRLYSGAFVLPKPSTTDLLQHPLGGVPTCSLSS